MPIAFKEWAVTVRALAEGEQLLTLRKGGIREPDKHFALEHDRFFLYPTFDHQRNDLVRESHQPELRRALEEGVWPEGEPPARALTMDGGIPQPDRVRIRAWAEVAGAWTITDRRAVDALSPFHVWTTGLRREAPGVEAPAPAARAAAAHVPHPAPGDGARPRGLRRMPLVAGDHPRPAVRGHAGAVGRGVRAGLRGDRGHRRQPTAPRPTPSAPWTTYGFPGYRRGRVRPGRPLRRHVACALLAARLQRRQLPPLPTLPPLPDGRPDGAASTGPAPAAYQANDAGGFRSILPSGTRGRYSLPELAAYLTTGATVPHCCDQLPMYRDLVYATPGLKAADIPKYFKDGSLRRARRRRRADLLAARRRDDRARPRLRRAAHLRRDALGRDVRARLRGRRGPAVLHGRAAPRGPRRAVELRRRRRTPARTPSSGRSRPTPRPTSSARSRDLPKYLGAQGAQIVARRRATTSRASTSTSSRPSSTRRSCRASTRRSGARRARTRSSRPTSSPPRRWSAGSSARAAARSSSSRSSPTRSSKRFGAQARRARVRATSARPRTPRRR